METFADLIARRRHDDRPGLRFEDMQWSWRQVVAAAERRAALVDSWPQDRPRHVAVMLDNLPEFLFWIYAAALSRATVVGVNTTRRGAELAGDIRHTDCTAMVTDVEHLGLIERADIGIPAERIHVVDDPSYAAATAGPVASGPPAAAPSDRLLLMFTSGSTGTPKAVVCTTGRLARIAVTSAELFGITPEDVCYQAMPMFHGNAVMANIAPATAQGATIVLRRRFSASGFASDIRRYDATYFNYVGRSLAYVLATPPATTDADNRLRLGFGTEATAHDRERFTARFECPLMETYGSSEGVVSMHRTADTPPAAMGVPAPLPGSDVAVVDPETLAECARAGFDDRGRLSNPDAAIGEIVNRGGPVGFEGYYRNPAATAERVRHGWYWTGDLGYRDMAGFFYFAGRTADRLRVDSENFAAAPIERILQRHPDIAVAAVYPVPDPRTGDQVMAALELVPGTRFDPAAFDRFLAAQDDLGTKWTPRFLRVVDAVPVTGSNKVAKAALRRERWTAEPVWWRPTSGDSYRLMTVEDRAGWHGEFAAHGRDHLLDVGL